MIYKLYDIYNQKDEKILTAEAKICAEFMGFTKKQSFYDFIRRSKGEKMMCNNGFYAKESAVKPETKCKEVKSVIKMKLLKNLLVPEKNKNLKRLVKIRKGEIYLYDNKANKDKDTIILAKKVIQIDETKTKYKDVLKLKRNDLNRCFKKYK